MLKKICVLLSKSALSNILWLSFDRGIRLTVGLAFSVWLARYLGVESFGTYSFIMALVSMFSIISAVGMQGIVVREIIVSRTPVGEILGTAVLIRLVASLVVYLVLIFIVFYLRPDDGVSKKLALIMGLVLLFRFSDIFKYWNESQLVNKYTAISESLSFIAASVLRATFILMSFGVVYFALPVVLEGILVLFGLWLFYRLQLEEGCRWRISIEKAKYLIKASWPLILSSSAWVMYTKVDQVMIGQLMGDEVVGAYSVAVKISEVIGMLAVVMITSMVPNAIKVLNVDRNEYEKKFAQIYSVVAWSTIPFCALLYVFSEEVISLLFGPSYMGAASILNIYIWMPLFTGLAKVGGRYLVNDNMQKVTMIRHIAGLVLNVPFNLVVIPVWGAEGAACASLAVVALTNYFADALFVSTRKMFVHKTKAIFPLFLFKWWV